MAIVPRDIEVMIVAYKLYAVRVFSFKWDESYAFYKDTIGLHPTFEDRSMGWAEFDLGGVSLGLERQDPADAEAQELVGRFVGISIQVDDIEAVYDELCRKGVVFVEPPERQPWGGTLAHFKDPDGNIITLLGGTNA